MLFLQNTVALLYELSFLELILLLLSENALVIILALSVGNFWDQKINQTKISITKRELFWTASTLLFNTIVTVTGFLMIKSEWIILTYEPSLSIIFLDTMLLFLCMDFLMFIFHYCIHTIKPLSKIHGLHHEFENPTTITLFVLHPIEILGFGMLWIGLLLTFKINCLSLILYLILNLIWGIAGHLQIEIIPNAWRKSGITKWIASTKFHHQHHQHPSTNFGFYTLLWDKLFKTLK